MLIGSSFHGISEARAGSDAGPELTFEGDSMDREHVRAVLEEQGFQGVAA